MKLLESLSAPPGTHVNQTEKSTLLPLPPALESWEVNITNSRKMLGIMSVLVNVRYLHCLLKDYLISKNSQGGASAIVN